MNYWELNMYEPWELAERVEAEYLQTKYPAIEKWHVMSVMYTNIDRFNQWMYQIVIRRET